MMLELARPQDRGEIQAIKRQIHLMHVSWRPDIYAMAEDLYPESFFLEDIQEGRVYVAREAERIAGYVRFQIRDFHGPGIVTRRVLMLEEIGVAEDCRGRGIGSAMMEDIQTLAKSQGCTDLQLSVQPENEAAQALYRKFGFTARNVNMQRKV